MMTINGKRTEKGECANGTKVCTNQNQEGTNSNRQTTTGGSQTGTGGDGKRWARNMVRNKNCKAGIFSFDAKNLVFIPIVDIGEI